MRALATLALTLCLGLAACGGSGGGAEGDVKDSLKTFANAAIDGDGDKACQQLAKATREQLSVGDKDCGDIFGSIAGDFKKQAKDQLDEIDDLDIKIDGNTATIKDDSGESSKMVKEDGDWKLSIDQ